VVIRTVATREIVASLPLPEANAGPAFFHPSGDWLAVVHAGGSKAVRVWDLRTPGAFFDIGSDVAQNFGTNFNPDGDLMVTQRDSDPSTVEVWSFPDGELQYSGPDGARGGSFSNDGRRLAFVEVPEAQGVVPEAQGVVPEAQGEVLESGPSILHIVEVAPWRKLQTIPLVGLIGPPAALATAFAPDGDRLVIADRETVALIDLRKKRVVWRQPTEHPVFQPVWHPDGDRLFLGGQGATILDARTGGVIERLPGHRGGTFLYAAIPGTDWVASGGGSNEETIMLDLGPSLLAELGTFASPIDGVKDMVAVGDGSHLAVSVRHGNGVIDTKTGDLIYDRQGIAPPDISPLLAVYPVFSANGLYSAGSYSWGESRLWSNEDGRVLFDSPDAQIRGMSEDGALAVLVGSSTQLVNVVGTFIAELDVAGGTWHSAVFSPDGRYVATITSTIQIWDTATGAQVGSIEEYLLLGSSIQWTPDGRLLIVGGMDGFVNVFDVERLLAGVPDWDALSRRITAHVGSTFVECCMDGSLILTVAQGEPAKVWDLETGALVGEFGTPAEGDFVAAAFHPTEPTLYAEVGADQIGIFTLDVDELMEIARSRLSRDLTEEECQLYLRRSCGQNG
jgi:WD40 repeat protein